jgi:RNA polymerase sigma factor (sigma-70 family)
VFKDKSCPEAQLFDLNEDASSSLLSEREIEQLSFAKDRFPTREEETALINDIQGRYTILLEELSNAPGIINSLVYVAECIEKHDLSLSAFMDRGERSAPQLEEDFLELAQRAKLLKERWDNSSREIKSRSDIEGFDNPGAIDLLDKHFQIELEAKELFREFKFSTAVVDCMAPHYITSEHRDRDSTIAAHKIEKVFNEVVPLRDLLFAFQEGIVVTDVCRRAPYLSSAQDGGARFEDVMQEARQSLNTALHRFDTSRGLKFSTFAVQWIGAAVYNDIYKNSSIIRVPTGTQKAIYKMDREGKSIEELAGNNDESLEILAQAQKALSAISLENSLDSHAGDQGIRNIISGDDEIVYDSDVEIVAEYRKQVVEIIHTSLDPRSSDILISRYGLTGNEPQSLRELGLKYGICSNRVSQIEKAAFKKVRELLPGFESKVFLD